ncbi:MAG: class I SAM-dependent methyltransferase [Gemmatimonadota bacterium]|nr:class I SAM-dependent methyltransferase [Gemmatimonadota bacterium]
MTRYSTAWFDTFLPAADPPPVDREVAFFRRHFPVRRFPRVLDVACGIGRHARALAEAGYEVTGLDHDAKALEAARAGAPAGAVFVQRDMGDLDRLEDRFDVVACLWQSFGWSDAETNREVLGAMGRRLRPGGRVLLDIYNREALPALPIEEIAVRRGRKFRTRRTLVGDRFRVRISYEGSREVDELDWQVFDPPEIATLGEEVGLAHVFTCAWFDESMPAGPDHVRMQVVFEG